MIYAGKNVLVKVLLTLFFVIGTETRNETKKRERTRERDRQIKR